MRGCLSPLWSPTERNDASLCLCEQALRIDNRNVRALVILAVRSLVRGRSLLRDNPQADRVKADELTSRALAVDSNNYLAHFARSYFLAAQRPDEAIAEAERSLALNPSFLPTYSSLWLAERAAGRFEKADEYADEALRLSPRDTLAYVYLFEKGVGKFTVSRYEDATDFFKGSMAENPEYVPSYLLLTASLALSGHDRDASETLRRYLELPLDIPRTIAEVRTRQPDDAPALRSYHDRRRAQSGAAGGVSFGAHAGK